MTLVGRARCGRPPRCLALGVAICAIGMAGCGSDGAGAEPSAVPTSSTSPPPGDESDSWRSVRVVDGDTVEVSGPDGDMTVRLIGINTPESGECFGEEASEALARLVSGAELVLVEDRSDVDRFGRALRYVETANGVDVGAELVAGGFAIARRYPPDDARADVYADRQREAQREQRGLWAPDACGIGDGGGAQIEVEVNADAPGDDGRNLNGEWARFTNIDADPVDLDGWEVADESASNRYRFSDLVLQPGAGVTVFSGCGPDDDTSRFWCVSGSAVWNNSGDTVFLRDPQGNIVVSLSYGDSA
jgi:endonuclease YncB( thermonuclease family)